MSLIDKMKKSGNPELHSFVYFSEIKLLQLFLKNHVTLMEKGWFLYSTIPNYFMVYYNLYPILLNFFPSHFAA